MQEIETTLHHSALLLNVDLIQEENQSDLPEKLRLASTEKWIITGTICMNPLFGLWCIRSMDK
jgi:hypothetical protein